jgi:hypothetical protein
MSCPTITEIPREQCIGNSLSIINNNFSNLRESICLPDTGIDDQVISLTNSRNTFQTLYTNLTGPAVRGAAKAWVKFDGLRGINDLANGPYTLTGPRFIYSRYNVDFVNMTTENGVQLPGHYTIILSSNIFSSSNYTVIGTSSEATIDNKYTWFQPITYTQSYLTAKVQTHDGLMTNARHISVVFF